MTEQLRTPEQSPNQPFHDLLHNFAQRILSEAQSSLRANGMAGYQLDTQVEYEQHIDELLAERDKQIQGSNK